MFDRIKQIWGRLFGGGSPTARDRFYQAVDRFRARYEAAETTAENQPLWTLTDFLSAKAANSFQVRRTLKIRSRYEAVNNSYFRGIINTLVCDLIGRGPRLQVRTPDDAVNKQTQSAFKAWADAADFGAKLALMAKGKIQDGEGFGLFFTNRDLESPVQLDINVIESDQVTTPNPGFMDYFWVDGVVLNKAGVPTAYHVLENHPGDLYFPQLNPLKYKTWPARSVLHFVRKDRPGQVRGVPEITPALDLFAQLRRFTKAVLAAAELAADFAAVLESEMPANIDPNDPANAAVKPFDRQPMDRGMMTALPYGYKLSQLTPQQPATTYEMFVRLMLREIARCLGIPLGLAMGDHSTYNYSSGRLDGLPYHRQQRVERNECERNVLSRIFRAWLEEAVMIPGLLPAGLNISDVPHRWFWDAADSIDPVKDATADELELANFTTTLEEKCAERGEDWEEIVEQAGREYAKKKAVGLPVASQPAAAPKQKTVVKAESEASIAA